MPPRPHYIVPRLSVTDAPVLPFLAPRVFAVWTPALAPRRRYTRSVRLQEDQTSKRKPSQDSDAYRKQYRAEPSTIDDTDEALQHPAEQWVERLARSQTGSTKEHVRRRLNFGINNTDLDEDSQAKFDEIWVRAHNAGQETTSSMPRTDKSIADNTIGSTNILHISTDLKLGPERKRSIKSKANFKDSLSGQIMSKRDRNAERRHSHVRRRRLHNRRVRFLGFRWSTGKTRYSEPRFPHGLTTRLLCPRGNPMSLLLWRRRIAYIGRRYTETRSDSVDQVNLLFHPNDQEFAEKLLQCESVHDMWRLWKLEAFRYQAIWDSVIAWALHLNPLKTLDILIATTNEYRPTYVVADTLNFIVACQLKKPNKLTKADHTTASRILMGIHQILTKELGFHLTQKTIFYLMRNLDTPNCVMFFELLQYHDVPMRNHTKLQFAYSLGKAGATEEAITVLEQCTVLRSPIAARICTIILDNKASGLSSSELFARMHSFGLLPTPGILNILIRDTLADGDEQTAWKIYDTMEKSYVLQPTDHTYSHFLNYAKSAGDEELLHRVVRLVKLNGIRNEYIATDLLHTVYLIFDAKRQMNQRQTLRLAKTLGPWSIEMYKVAEPATPFKTMLSIYSEYFDMQPLKDFMLRYVILNKSAIRDPEPGVVLMQPGDHTLSVMLTGVLQDIKDPSMLASFYQGIKSLVASGHPIALRLAQDAVLHNILLQHMGKHESLLPLCTEIVRNMLNSGTSPESEHIAEGNQIGTVAETEYGSEATEADPESQGSWTHATNADTKPFQTSIAKPTVRTWNIFLSAFLQHNQPGAAEMVFETMKERGVEPNLVTYNTLASYYARRQDTHMTVDVMQRMRGAGLDADRLTYKALEWIRNHDALNAALAKMQIRAIEGERETSYEYPDKERDTASEIDQEW